MRSLAAFFAALIVTACASAGATFGSGVGDRQLEHPPWYAGRAATEDMRIARLPIAYQRGADVIAVVPRLVRNACGQWHGTSLSLPPGNWRNVLGARTVTGAIDVGELWRDFPIALLERES